MAMDKSGIPGNTRRPLKAQYPEIEHAVSEFVGSYDHNVCRSRSVSFRSVLGYCRKLRVGLEQARRAVNFSMAAQCQVNEMMRHDADELLGMQFGVRPMK
eukprot:IDg518t1